MAHTGLIAETLLRIWYSIFLLPFGNISDEGDEAVRTFARAVVLPMLGLAIPTTDNSGFAADSL